MKTSEKAKAAGLKNLAELSELTGQSPQTLRSWDENKPELFKIVLDGAVKKKDALVEFVSHIKNLEKNSQE